jgi:hypothetical protein
LDGVVAQLVERLVRNEKVAGSIPVGSTIQLRQGFSLLPGSGFRATGFLPAAFEGFFDQFLGETELVGFHAFSFGKANDFLMKF